MTVISQKKLGTLKTQQSRRLFLIFWPFLFLTAFAVGYHMIFQDKGPNYASFLVNPVVRFSDLLDPAYHSRNFDPYYSGALMNYFPLSYLFFGILAIIPAFWQLFVVFSALAGSLLLLIQDRIFSQLQKKHNLLFYLTVLLILLFNYPVLFAVDRGNLDLIIFCGFVITYVFYGKRPLLADFSLACIIAFKAYPALFLLLYIKDKNYKRIFKVILMTLSFEWLALLIFKGTILSNLAGQVIQQTKFVSLYAVDDRGVAFGHSIWGLLKSTSFLLEIPVDFASLFPYFYIPIVLISGLSILLVLRYPLKDWQTLLVIVCLMSLMPHVSFDYKLIHFLLPLSLFIADSETNFPLERTYAILFAVIIAPLGYSLQWFVPDIPGNYHVSIIVKPIVLSSILILLFVDAKKNLKPQELKDYIRL